MAAASGEATRVGDRDAVVAAARAGEPDRYLSALLAPPAARTALLALAAFAAELARVPRLAAREPAMGEIRLQWWRDALALPAGSRTGNPVADALREAAARHALPPALLDGMIDGRTLELQAMPFADDAALDAYLWKTEGAHFALAGSIVGLPQDPAGARTAATAGQAYGLARLLLGLPDALARGRVPLPLARLRADGVAPEALLAGEGNPRTLALLGALRADARALMGAARQIVANLPRGQRVAFLPLALVEPYLRVLERADQQPLREAAQIAPLTRLVRIAAAHWFGRL